MKTIQVRVESARSYSGGWTVARARFEGPSPSDSPISQARDLFSLVGVIAVKRGDVVSATGEWSTHEKYGLQFKASLCVPVVNNSEAGVVAFLDRLPQVGPIRARQLIRMLGAEGVICALESEPGKLTCVPGIDQNRADAIAEAFKEERDLYESFLFLSQLGLEQGAVAGALKLWERAAKAIVAADPYQLLEVDGLSFESVDGVARSQMGIALDDPRRCAAGFRLALSEMTQAGHTWAPAAVLTASDPQSPLSKRIAEKVKMSPEHLRIGLSVAADPSYRKAEGGRSAPLCVIDDQERVWDEPSMSAEMSIAADLHRLTASSEFKPIEMDSTDTPIDPALSEEQRRAVELVLTKPIVVITSGPGCGKTFSVNATVRVLEGAGLSVVLCAPTGKAAQRMKELAGGHEATTIHRLLGNILEPSEISAKVVVVDESSMCSVDLFAALTSSIQDGARFVIVGDVDQLPSIGPGAVLADLIGSGVIPTARLTKIFRQASESYIPYLARAINLGEPPDVSVPRPDVAFVELDNENLPESVVQAFLGIAADGGAESVIVCAPQRNKGMGVEALNRQIQAALVPDGEALWIGGQYQARVGDRVVHTVNDYELLTSIGPGVFNGEIGMVEALNFNGLPEHVVREAKIHEGYSLQDGRTDRVMVIRYLDKAAVYSKLQVRKLHLGWALTVHKCQGSQMDSVIFVCSTEHAFMLDRSLAYTAVTRAAKRLLILGQQSALNRAVTSTFRKQRMTGLAEFLRDRFGGEP